MSGSGGGDGGPVSRREVAVRCFAAEYDDASLEYSESDEERAPNYVVTPTGARINRLFVVGVLTEVEQVSDDVLRGRVVDPTGAFVVYAGQYQPDAKTALERLEPPAFVAVTGKARTFEPDDGDRVYTSIRPESINEVDAETRDRWTVQTAEHTAARIATAAAALEREERGGALSGVLESSGVDPALAAGVPKAIDHYGTTPAYLAAVREVALQAAAVVAGRRDEVDPLDVAPDEGGPVEADLTAGVELAPAGTGSAEAATPTAAEPAAETGSPAAADADAGAATESPSAATVEEESAGSGVDASSEPGPDEPGEGGAGGVSDDQEPEECGSAAAGTEPDAGVATGADDELGDFDDRGPGAGAGPDETTGSVDSAESGHDVGADVEEPSAPDTGPAGTGGTDEMYELDEEEVEAVEEEFGTEFSTGNEVETAGEAGIETPDPGAGDEEVAPEGAEGAAEAPGDAAEGGDEAPDDAAEAAPEEQDEAESGEPESGEPAATEDVDLVDATVAAMEELDEGAGADRDAVIEAVAAEHGVDDAAVEDAIDEALMGGRCYEPDDGLLKAI